VIADVSFEIVARRFPMVSRALHRVDHRPWVRVLSIALFALATAISARLSVLTPFSPVPLTLQVLVVLLSGLLLGPRDGLLAQLAYLQAVLLGAPATATGLVGPAAFAGPTAGYLLAFPAAAFAAGWLAQRISVRLVGRALGALAGIVVIYAVGTAWLSVYLGSLPLAINAGVLPFVGADLLKATIAVGVASARQR